MGLFQRAPKDVALADERLLVLCGNQDHADRVCFVLQKNGIPYRCRVREVPPGVLEFGGFLRKSIEVYVREPDLARARELLEHLPAPRPGAES